MYHTRLLLRPLLDRLWVYLLIYVYMQWVNTIRTYLYISKPFTQLMFAHVAYLYVVILNCVDYSHKCILYAMHMHVRLLLLVSSLPCVNFSTAWLLSCPSPRTLSHPLPPLPTLEEFPLSIFSGCPFPNFNVYVMVSLPLPSSCLVVVERWVSVGLLTLNLFRHP